MSAAACHHHWIALDSKWTFHSETIHVTLGCILCFKHVGAVFQPLGYTLDVKTARAQRAAKKDLKR